MAVHVLKSIKVIKNKIIKGYKGDLSCKSILPQQKMYRADEICKRSLLQLLISSLQSHKKKLPQQGADNSFDCFD